MTIPSYALKHSSDDWKRIKKLRRRHFTRRELILRGWSKKQFDCLRDKNGQPEPDAWTHGEYQLHFWSKSRCKAIEKQFAGDERFAKRRRERKVAYRNAYAEYTETIDNAILAHKWEAETDAFFNSKFRKSEEKKRAERLKDVRESMARARKAEENARRFPASFYKEG